MTKPVRIARLVMARRKLRDVAAGELAEADLETAAAAAQQLSAEATLEAAYSPSGLAAIARARDLLLLEDERHAARADVRTAAEKVEAARVASAKQRSRLMGRERELRLAEELHDRAIDERNARLDRAEQGEHDDRSAARQVTR
jgi:hypothetical protein